MLRSACPRVQQGPMLLDRLAALAFRLPILLKSRARSVDNPTEALSERTRDG